MTAVSGDLQKLSTEQFELKTHEFKEDFENISIHAFTEEIVIQPSKDYNSYVEVNTFKNIHDDVSIENNTLTVNIKDERKWYHFIGMFMDSPRIELYLPKSEYEDLHIETSTGDVWNDSGIGFRNVMIDGSTGNVKHKGKSSGNVEINSKTGDMEIERSTGDIVFENSDASIITAKTSTGNIKGTLLNDKAFKAESSTGNVNVPDSIEGEFCELKTSTGNIDIAIKK